MARKRKIHPTARPIGRPAEIIAVTACILFQAFLFLGSGIWFTYEVLVDKVFGPGSERGIVLTIPVLLLGLGYAWLAWGFYSLQKWAYPVARGLLRNGWLIPFLFGASGKIDDPAVRQAFGSAFEVN